MSSSFVRLFAVLVAPLVGFPAQAQLNAQVVDERLSFLEERLEASRKHGQYWQWGWLGVSGGGMAAGIAQAANQDGDDQAGSIVNAATGAIGATYLLLRPMEARHGADPIRSMPDGTLAQKQNKLLAAEALLERNAGRTKERTNWKAHLGSVAFNVAAGAFIVGFGNLGDAAIATGAGIAAGSLQLWSEPARPRQDWEDYQAFKRGTAMQDRRDWRVIPTVGGLAFRYDF